ncbi:pyruvate dehydrogenase protein X component, mitochondrial-like, partial [Anolis carolinensis]|uniref:pyruvate dehydrogenase protein X component, mitochondrial-like n=1 Tax=Anolis carolinensis TaxID=28377 RepID=UPI002F2B35FA
ATGLTVDVGDALGEIETDKAVVTMESTDGDILAKVMAQEGSESMSLGTPTGLLVEEGQEWKRVEIPSVIGEAASFSGPLATTPVPTPLSSVASLHKAEQHPEKLQFRSSPAASDILESHGLDVSSCTPSDPRGIFSKEDALSLLEQIQKGKPLEGKPVVSSLPSQQIEVPLMPSPDGKPVSAEHSPAPPVSVPGLPPSTGTFTEVPTSNIGRVIAKRLTESKSSVSHAYATAECDLGAVLKLRQELAKERMVSDSGSKMQGVSLKDVPAGLAPGTTCKPYTSRAAIAAVKHHRVKLEQEAHVDFAMAKSKVAPVQTPPRLELHATLLTAQLLVPAMLQPANSPLQKDIVVPVPEGDYISQRKRVRGLA